MVEVVAIPRGQIDQVWGRVAPFLCRALAHNHGEYGTEYIKEALESGVQQLFVMHEGGHIKAAVTAEIIRYPTKTICGLVAAGGDDIDEWLDQFMSVIGPIAKEQGAVELRISGRGGWERKMRRFGFEKVATILAREI